jgi:hypothetical protein
MFAQILFTQWKSMRIGMIPFVIAAFGLPIMAVQGLGGNHAVNSSAILNMQLLFQSWQAWLPIFPALALTVGSVTALNAWNWDHKGDHLYSLSMPIHRWQYALYKMGAGAVLLLLPTAGMWFGGLAASASLTLPEGLHTYPTLLAVRFLVAGILAYSAMFALASGTIRTTVIVFSALFGGVLVVTLAGDLLATAVPGWEWSISQFLKHAFTEWPGPFQVFSGNWALIDV